MNRSQWIAVLIAVVSIGWILSGVLIAGDPTVATPKTETTKEEAVIKVRVKDFEAVPYTDTVIVNGRTRASRDAEIRAEVDGLVTEVLFKKGQDVKTGEVLARLEVQDRAAKVQEAKEALSQREIEYNAAKSLENKGFNSKVTLAQKSAALESARAVLKRAELDLDKTEIRAPFDGVLDKQDIEIGDFANIGDRLFTIVDLDPVEVTGFVSEHHISQIKTGGTAKAKILGQNTREGTVSFVAPVANADTRTFQIDILIPNEDHTIPEGLTTEISIPVAQKMVHKISPAILSLDDAGVVGVKVLGPDNVISFAPITIVSDTPDYMLIEGLPDRVTLVTVGQEYVVSGQKVEPIYADKDSVL